MSVESYKMADEWYGRLHNGRLSRIVSRDIKIVPDSEKETEAEANVDGCVPGYSIIEAVEGQGRRACVEIHCP